MSSKPNLAAYPWGKATQRAQGDIPTQEQVNTALADLSKQSTGFNLSTLNNRQILEMAQEAIHHKLGSSTAWEIATPAVAYKGECQVAEVASPTYNFPPENPAFRVSAQIMGRVLELQILIEKDRS